ncbi:DUF1932 domain-containing protein [Pseudooceanicola sp. LIPI14-2-Ac024]|uniref:NAD(P)-dependent oxidoreductase n=1 Tax=Pseudooceanicola sp. LIPI14-2-Ac024 TaxID=3344875 RepID=UPI0035CFD48D
MQIAFIGFGEAGRAFVDSRRAGGTHAFSAYDIKDTPEMAAAMAERGIRQGVSPGAAIEGVRWVFSCVTADQSLNAARSVLPHLVQGQVLVDINSVSPGRKRQTAEEVEAAGARYLDMAVMAPVHPRGHATPVLMAGREAGELAADLLAAGFRGEVVEDAPGAATAIKMVRSLFVKGLEAITVEAMLAAEASGCFDRVLASLSASFPGLEWPGNVAYNFERTLKHGTRRAAEMEGSAATLNDLGLNGGLASEIARVQALMGALSAEDLAGGDLGGAIAEVVKLRLSKGASTG